MIINVIKRYFPTFINYISWWLQSVLPLWKQVEYYKEYQTKLKAYQGKDKATETINESLYLISIGTNDFLENYFAFPGRSSQYSVGLYQDFLAGIAKDFVKKLHGLGARKISLGGLPPMGCMPLERATNLGTGGECVGRYNDIAVQFNSKLEKLVEKLSKELPGSNLVFSNPYEPFMRIIKNPSSFGKWINNTNFIIFSILYVVIVVWMVKKMKGLRWWEQHVVRRGCSRWDMVVKGITHSHVPMQTSMCFGIHFTQHRRLITSWPMLSWTARSLTSYK